MRLTQLTFLACLVIISAGLQTNSAKAALPPSNRWIVILSEAPVVKRYPGRIERTRAAAAPYRVHLQQAQAAMRAQIESLNARVTGSVQHLINAVFVNATPAQAEAIRKLLGVQAVVPSRWYHMADQLSISQVESAWANSRISGSSNAGAGIKIGILDSGIDQTRPSFQDSSLTAPSGFPKFDQSNEQFTSNKVIVARSYVSYLVNSDQTVSDPAAQSRPDDLSARDLVGHGTAVASVAAGVCCGVSYNGSPVRGVAPKAFLGNYKIFGSDEVNGGASNQAIIQALDDAVTDGMDVVNMSFGSAAFGGPLDTGCSNTGLPGGPISIDPTACDPLAYEIESAMENGQVIVVAAAGNEAENGYQFNLGDGTPTFATISSPAYAPSAIAAGGVNNDVTYVQKVEVSGSGVPSNLKSINATSSLDGPLPAALFTAPLLDVTQAGNSNGYLCTPLPASSLSGVIALVLRGSCDTNDDGTKVTNAQNAGAVGIILIDDGRGLGTLFVGSGIGIPAFLIGQADGANLKAYADAHPKTPTTMDPTPYQVPASELGYPALAATLFASRGPVTATGDLKPDVSAAATDFLLSTQHYDPRGEVFSVNGYATADGTSFATPMLTGAAALVLQANSGASNISPLQVKSALVNTATVAGVTSFDGSSPVSLAEVGGGLLQAQNAVSTTVQFVPSAVSFGQLAQGGPLPGAQTLTILNAGSSPATLKLSVSQNNAFSTNSAKVEINGATTTNVTVQASSTLNVSVTLTGTAPAPGRYEGFITATGIPVTLTVPYMFVVGDGVPYDVIPLNVTPPGYMGFDGPVGATVPWTNTVSCSGVNSCVLDYGPVAFQLIDQYGVGVANASVTWSVTSGNGQVLQGSSYTDSITDANGFAGASVVLGSTEELQEFSATIQGISHPMPFDGYARQVPVINANGIVDGASYTGGRAVAPGSWISVFGLNLTDTTQGNNGVDEAYDNCPTECSPVNQPFPMGINGVAFSFDTSSGNSYPGRFSFVSPHQVNLLVPWELAGETSVTVKVIVNYTYSAEYTLPIATYSPGFFQYDYTSEVAALDQNNHVVTSSNPVVRGNVVQLFMNGLGPVNNQPADGAGAPSDPHALATTKVNPTITIGGQQATLQFSGLSPNSASLYQVNVIVPTGIGTGDQTITCSIGGVSAKSGVLAVK